MPKITDSTPLRAIDHSFSISRRGMTAMTILSMPLKMAQKAMM